MEGETKSNDKFAYKKDWTKDVISLNMLRLSKKYEDLYRS